MLRHQCYRSPIACLGCDGAPAVGQDVPCQVGEHQVVSEAGDWSSSRSGSSDEDARLFQGRPATEVLVSTQSNVSFDLSAFES